MMQTLSPMVRNKMRIIYIAHSKYQSSEIKKRDKRNHNGWATGNYAGTEEAGSFHAGNKTHQRGNWKM